MRAAGAVLCALQGIRSLRCAGSIVCLVPGVVGHGARQAVTYRAVIVSHADIGAACDLAVTASLAVLRAVRPDQLQAIDASAEPTATQ